MANYTSTANIVLSVNGKQAQKMLSTLEKDAKRLEKQIAKASVAGDKATMKKLQRELRNTNRLIDQLKGSAATTENTLRRLDAATPKELNKALRQLQTQLNGMQRGTAAWDRQVAKIRAVKAELQKVNATLATQKTMWQRMTGWVNNAQAALIGAAAALTGFILAGRKAVSQYADMEESMANTVKYTRMTAEQVEELNRIFKKMDTRLYRDQLNTLAQEGGRLGYNTVQKVKEYVEAAAIINVALVDLGEGATQTIAKLSNIFGMEEMYGVKDAMLKVGSTVNHLSQNCTAAKPFIVEFSQRMAGIGSTAKMTIPEIMAFAATLDAHGQKVEMSATALQRTIMTLFKKPGEMAQKVGLDTSKFIETLNKSTTQGIMMFLDALNKIGEDKALAILSPLFQDLGLDGARVASVLSNLSSHLEFLKWQMGEANQAFREGTSASNEYAIFNNTIQASIEKAKGRVRELSIELGEKLYPIMKHIYTSSSAFLRMLNQIVSFVIKYKSALITLGATLAAYYTASFAARTITFLLTKAMTAYRVIVIACTRTHLLFNNALLAGKPIIAAVNLLIVACRNAVAYFTNGLEVNLAMQTRWRTAMAAMKLGTWVGLITSLAAAIYLVASKTKTNTDRLADLTKVSEDFDKEVIKEIRHLDEMFGRLDACEKGSKEYKSAKDAILKQYGGYLKGLINEKGEIINLERAYNRLTLAIQRSAQARLLDKMKENVEDQFVKDLNNKINAMKEQLTKWGMPLREITKVTTQIYMAAAKGQPVPQDVNKAIFKYTSSFSQHGDESVIGKFFNWLNPFQDQPWDITMDINDLVKGYSNATNAIESASKDLRQYKEYDDDTLKMSIDYLKKGIGEYEERLQQSSGRANLKYNIFNNDFTGNPVDRAFDKMMETNLGAGSVVFYLPDQKTSVGQSIKSHSMTPEQAKSFLAGLEDEYAIRTGGTSYDMGPVSGNPDFNIDEYTPYVSEKERKKQEREQAAADRKAQAEAKRAAIKARQEFKDALNATKGTWEADSAVNTTEYSNGLKSWTDYLLRKHELEMKYYTDRQEVYKNFNLTEDEDYQELLKKKAEYEAEWLRQNAALKVQEAQRLQKAEETQAEMDYNTPGNEMYGKEEAHQQRLFEIRMKYLRQMQAAYHRASEEWHNYQVQIEQAEAAEQLRRQKLLAQRVAEWKKKYEYKQAGERYDLENELLIEAWSKNMISYQEYLEAQRDLKKKYVDEYMPDSAKPNSESREQQSKAMKREMEIIKSLYDQGLISKEQYEKAKERIENVYNKKSIDGARKFGSEQTNQLLDIYEAWQNFFNNTEEDGGNWATRLAALASSVFAVMNAGMQQASEYMQACTDIEVAKAEKKYDREIELAEGNSYKVKKAEKEKEREIAKIKSDAAKKQFAMQVIQAVAQTATNALNAYGSAAAVPVIGYILAPIAAAMAVAAGAMQIATIKKQQQASEAQGYQSGGFTPEGKPDEVAGVVHKGEWVASQRLVNNPRTRPLLEALDYAQRTNTIGSITSADVSRTITAPAVIASQQSNAPTIVNNTMSDPRVTEALESLSALHSPLSASISRLNERLNEPFVTVNTVTGDHGIQRAQNEYDRLMKNKSPKSKK